MTPDYFDALDTSHRISHGAALKRHDKHDADADAIKTEIAKLRDELFAVNQRLDKITAAGEESAKALCSTRLVRVLKWLGLL